MRVSILKLDEKYLTFVVETEEFELTDIQHRSEPPLLFEKMNINTVVIHTTLECNLACRYCYARAGEEKGTLSFEQMKNFIDLLFELGTIKPQIVITGGEPTLLKDKLIKIIKYAQSVLIFPRIIVATNGIISENMLSELMKLNVEFHLSFEGIPIINDKERPFPNGEGSSERVLEVIKKIVKWDPKKLIVRFNVSKPKVEKIREIAQFFKEKGIEIVEFGWMTPTGRGKQYEDVLKRDAAIITKFYKIFQEEGLPIPKHPLKAVRWPGCGAGYSHLSLTSDGKISLCQGVVSEKKYDGFGKIDTYSVGYVTDNSAILQEDRLKSFREDISKIPEKCQKCSLLIFCAPCPLHLKKIDGKLSFDSEFCKTQEEITIAHIKLKNGRYFKNVKQVQLCEL